MSEHPSDDALSAYLSGRLSQEDSAPIEAHLSACSECVSRLDAASSGTDSFQKRLNEAVTPPNGGDHPAESSGVAAGTHVGPYILVERLGVGGMGEVWLARQEEPVKRSVALKLVKTDFAGPRVLARFEAERQALALMQHPNIAQVFDAGAMPDGRPYFVMEWVQGVPINRYCDDKNLTPAERLGLFIPVCQAVQHAHQKGIIHRDLKPSNILVSEVDGKPTPKVIDFGIAKATSGQALTDRTMLTDFGQILGTLEYMAPEQAAPNNVDIDTRADVYALGAILYELLAGSPPFSARQLREAGFAETLRLIREDEPLKPSTKLSSSAELPSIAANRKTEPRRLAKAVKGELDWVVMKCLEKDRARRYENVNQLAMELRRYLANEPIEAGPPSPWYRARKFYRRNRGPVWAATTLVAVLLLGIAGSTWQMVRAQDAEENARRNEANALRERDEKEKARAAEENERIKAQKRLAQVERGVKLLTEVFRDLDPALTAGDDKSLRQTLGENLERSAKQLSGDAVADAVAASKLQIALGSSLRWLGRYPTALELCEVAAATLESELGPNHLDSLRAKRVVGMLLLSVNRADRALPMLLTTQEKLEATLGLNNAEAIETLKGLHAAYGFTGKFDKDLETLERLLRAQEAVLGPGHADLLDTQGAIGYCHFKRGRADLAIPILETTGAAQTARHGERHYRTLSTGFSLGLAYLKAGKTQPGMDALERAATTARRQFGPSHKITMRFTEAWVSYLQKTGHVNRAAAVAEDFAAGARDLYRSEPTRLAAALEILAHLLMDTSKPAEAEQVYREILALKQEHTPQDWNTHYIRFCVATSLKAQQKGAEAEPLFIAAYEGLAAHAATLPPEGRGVWAGARNSLAAYYAKSGQTDKAAEWRAKAPLDVPSDNKR
jgi:eukaryotic-like serine/threonine-protein kinase